MSSAIGDVASRAARAGDAVLRQLRSALGSGDGSGPGAAGAPASGWLVVTVNREPTEVDTDPLPAPLAEFGDRIETRIRPAAGDRGTELAARLVRPAAGSAPAPTRLMGDDPQGELRSALRRAKQLIEVGEVLRVDPAPHGERTASPAGGALEAVTKRASKGGVL